MTTPHTKHNNIIYGGSTLTWVTIPVVRKNNDATIADYNQSIYKQIVHILYYSPPPTYMYTVLTRYALISP